MAINHMDLAEYYNLNFALFHFHKYPIEWIENLVPFERDIYVQLLMDNIKEQKELENR